jgi:cytoskeletal protein CcmA (bactofilin family)
VSVASSSRVRLALLVVLGAALMLALPQPALAQGIVYGQSIPSGVVVENDVLLAGETVTIDGTVLGDVVAVGTTVRVNGQIRGSLITAAQTISINGSVGGTIYSAAADLLLGPTADIQRNLYYAGLSMTAQRGSRIERDLLGVTFGATLGGSIGRETRAVIGPLEIARMIISIAKWDVKIPILTSPTSSISSPAAAVRSHGFTLTAAASRVQAAAQRGEMRTAGPSAPIDFAPVWAWLLQELRVLASLVVMALLVAWLLPTFTADAADRVRARPLLALGYGLIGLVIAVNLIGVALVIGVLMLAIGLSLGYASLWNLTFLFWGVGFSALGLAVFILAAFVLYGSRMIVTYLVGSLILVRWPNLARHRWLPLLVGLIPYLLVTSIPWIGWIFDILFMSVGLGAAWLTFRSKREVSTPPIVEVATQSEPPAPPEPATPVGVRRKAPRGREAASTL